MTQNIQTPSPASGDVLDPALDSRTIGNKAQPQNEIDPIMNDIDAMFGGNDPGAALGDDTGASGTPAVDGEGLPVTPIQEDPQKAFDGMTAEQRATHFQSLLNKTENELKNIKPQYEKYKDVAEFVNQVYEDPSVKAAFLAEIAPDLVKPSDPYESLQERLGQEFGEDFVPDDDEATKPLSKSWRYFKRVDELYKDLTDKGGTKAPTSLKELREQRAAEAKLQSENADKERVDIMNDMKWGSTDWQEFSNWATKIEGKHLARWYEGLQKQKGSKAPNLANQFGGQAPVSIPEHFKELNKHFG